MTSIMLPPRVSFESARDLGILDKGFVREVETKFPSNRFDGQLSMQADYYLQNAGVEALNGIGKARGNLLNSRKYNIETVGDFARYDGAFDHPIVRPDLDQQTLSVFRALHTALQIATPFEPRVGREISINESDPRLQASVIEGKGTIGHNAGEEGAAYLILKGDPSNNGFAASFLNLTLGGYTAQGRRGEISFDPINIQIGPGLPNNLRGVADAISSEIKAQGGLNATVEQPREGGGIRVKIWSTQAVD
jgi:hypothetical protein